MKKLLLFGIVFLFLVSSVTAIDCSVWSCNRADYSVAEFETDYNGTAIPDGTAVTAGGWYQKKAEVEK